MQIVAAFGAYIVADELLEVSGLLAIVALGTWLAAKGNHRISAHVTKPMREVWCAACHRPTTASMQCERHSAPYPQC